MDGVVAAAVGKNSNSNSNLNSNPNPNEDEEITPASISGSSQASPIVDLTREYIQAAQTSSYNDIWRMIHSHEGEEEFGGLTSSSAHRILAQLLQPDRDSIQQVLQMPGERRPNNNNNSNRNNNNNNKLTRLVSDYFDNSEHTSYLCLLLTRSVDRARSIYRSIGDLTDLLPSPTQQQQQQQQQQQNQNHIISQSQCDWAFDLLSHFQSHDNPFPSPDSGNFRDTRQCFLQLKEQLDRCLHQARHRVSLLRWTTNCSSICLIGTVIGILVSAVVIAAHAIPALVAAPLLSFLPTHLVVNKQQLLDHIAQLDAAAKGTFVLYSDLDTVDRLVASLHDTVESDRQLVRLGLEWGRERYPIQEVVKQLRKNLPTFLHQLEDLEVHLCLCFATVNRARSLLLQQIHPNHHNQTQG